MNFLAHIFLSHDSEEHMVGNFIADFVKGSNFSQYPEGIGSGIRLHRAIDAYTDSHAVVHRSISRLRPTYGRYAGVLVDVFYDHVLARTWDSYCPQPLDAFSQWAYDTLGRYLDKLPPKVVAFFPYMVEQNWLLHYGTEYGMLQSLKGIDRRTSGPTALANAVEELREFYPEFEAEFAEFFPELQAHVAAWRKGNI